MTVRPLRRADGAALPPAVIAGMEANGLGVSRSLARHGIPSIGLAAPGPTPIFATRSCRVVRGSAYTREATIADLKRIADEIGERTVLIATKDELVTWLAEAADELEPLFHLAFPAASLVELLMSKQRFLDLARAEGWPLPKTWSIAATDELEAVLGEVPFPCILKPQVKNDAFREHSPSKAFKVFDADELRRVYAMASRWEPEMVIQEWIGGGDDRVAFCLSYRGVSGRRAAFAGRKLLQWPVECGSTALSEPAPGPWQAGLIEWTERIWERLGFTGIGSLEYKMRPGTDEPLIIEPTVGRTDYQSELAVLNGCNIPAMAYCDLMGIEYEAEQSPRRAVKLVDGPGHVKALRAYARAGKMGLGHWLFLRGGPKAYMIARRDDPGPLLASVKAQLRGAAGSVLESLVGRSAKDRIKRLLGPAAAGQESI